MKYLSLFSGVGGGDLALQHLLGFGSVGYVEIEEYCQRVIRQRIKDGFLDAAPIFGDIRRFSSEGYAESYTGMVDLVAGGFPCQGISECGRGAGLDDERSGLWSEYRRILRQVRPTFAFVENSPILNLRGLDRILGDLASLGYDATWGVFSACSVGAPHSRERMFLLAHADRERSQAGGTVGNGRGGKVAKRRKSQKHIYQTSKLIGGKIWPSRTPEPGISGVANGVAERVDRNKAAGNGQVPIVVKLAWETLTATVRPLVQIREKAIANGMELLTEDEVLEEVACRRSGKTRGTDRLATLTLGVVELDPNTD